MPPVASTTARARAAPTPSRWPSPMTCRVRPPIRPSAVCSRSSTSGVLDHLDAAGVEGPGDERALDLRAGRVAARMRDAVAVVTALAGQRQPPVCRAVEPGAPLGQLAHRGRALAHQHAAPRPRRRRRRPRRPCPGSAGRASHRLRARRRCRPAPSGSSRRPSTSLVTSRTRSALPADVQRGGEPGDARADDNDVGLGLPARARSRQPRRQFAHSSHRHVVDEPGAADLCGDEQPGRRRARATAPRSAPRSSR